MLLREFVDGTYVADARWCLSKKHMELMLLILGIQTIYIAPKAKHAEWSTLLDWVNIDVVPFGGGFKENSLVLFSLENLEDRKFFEKITEMKLH
jgi:hypothetical protein